MSVFELFDEMARLTEILKTQTGHVGPEHFGMSYVHRKDENGWPTDEADLRCGCREILRSFTAESKAT